MRKTNFALAIIGILVLCLGYTLAPASFGPGRLLTPEVLLGQTAPAANIPVNPSNLYANGIIYTASTTAGTATTLNAPSKTIGSAQRLYVYWAVCVNTSSTGVAATLKDNASSPVTYATIPCPASGVSSATSFNPPLALTIGTQPTFTATTAETTVYVTVGGYWDLR